MCSSLQASRSSLVTPPSAPAVAGTARQRIAGLSAVGAWRGGNGQAQWRSPCRVASSRLARPSCRSRRAGPRRSRRPRRRGCTAPRRAPRWRPAARAARGRRAGVRSARGEGVAVAGADDEAVALVAHEPAGGGADGVGGDDGEVLVHGFVGDEPPRLAEVAGGERRYDQNVGGGVGVADLLGRRPTRVGADDARGAPSASAARAATPRRRTPSPFSGTSRPTNSAVNGRVASRRRPASPRRRCRRPAARRRRARAPSRRA